MLTDVGPVEVRVPRDAVGTFEPQVVFVDDDNRIVEVGHDAGDVPDGVGLRTSAVRHGLDHAGAVRG